MKPLNYNQGRRATPHNNITTIRLHLCWTCCYWKYFKIWTYHNIALMLQLHLYSTACPASHWISIEKSKSHIRSQYCLETREYWRVTLTVTAADEWPGLDRLTWCWWRIWRLQTTPLHLCSCWLTNEAPVSGPVRVCCLGKFLTRDWLEFLLTIYPSARLVSLVSLLLLLRLLLLLLIILSQIILYSKVLVLVR